MARIHDMSPKEASELVGKYLHDVSPATRKSFIKSIRPIIAEYATDWVLPNKIKIGDHTMELENIDCDFDGDTTVSYTNTFYRPTNIEISFNSVDQYYEMLAKIGATVVAS